VVVGENDRPLHAASEYMTQKILGARQVMIPGAGHAVNVHQPRLFDAAVENFLAGIGDSSGE
jgi:pimeloyl-ACP methyl ester carboxylesterase